MLTVQGFADARVKLGDYHYYGRGTEVDYAAAGHEYQAAADARNAQVAAPSSAR